MRCVKIPLIDSNDFSFHSGQLAIWTAAEIATTIMATSIPVLRVFLRRMVTAHPGNGEGINRYHRSTADGLFLKSLHIASKGSQHTTTVTSRGCEPGSLKHSPSWRRKGQGDTSPSLESESGCGIMKVNTLEIDYDQRRSSDMLGQGSTLSVGRSRATSSVELNDVGRGEDLVFSK